MKFPEQYRWKSAPNGFHTEEGNPFGCFIVPGRNASGRVLKIIAADGEETGWEHVSVSLAEHPKKCPSWEEMCIVKHLFWDAGDCVVQFHPAEENYVNVGQVLHLWKSTVATFPTPPTICV